MFSRKASGLNCHISGGGPFTSECENLLAEDLGADQTKVLLTTSCTHALEMTTLLCNLSPGDEVIMPSFTFSSTANAYALHGVRPVFVDIRPDTLNLDESMIEAAITPQTKAIVVVHYAGVACEMDAILRIAAEHQLEVIEDNAHGLFGAYRGRPLGTLGRFGTLSFHETKNIICGEGGALIINRPEDVSRAEILREKGTNRAAFYRGEADKYSWIDIGSSYVISDLLAAVLKAQLDEAGSIQERRKTAWDFYFDRFATLENAGHVRRPIIPPHVDQAYHLFYLLTNSVEERDQLLDWLRTRSIHAVFHYLPLHSSPMGKKLMGDMKHGTSDSCPVTTDISQRLIRLPFYTEITPKDQAKVVHEINGFFQSRHAQ